jgi:phage-related protein
MFSSALTPVRKNANIKGGGLATVELIYYQEEDGAVPLIQWFDTLSPKAIQKCHVKLDRLEQLGHELRRPEADYLRDGIYELRASYQGVHYRMLYSFHGRAAVVVSHGLMKESAVPPREIDLAVKRKGWFEAKPERHAFRPKE